MEKPKVVMTSLGLFDIKLGTNSEVGAFLASAGFKGTAALRYQWITAHVQAYKLAERIPILCDLADARLVQKLHVQLARFGHAEYATHGEAYRPAPQPAVAV